MTARRSALQVLKLHKVLQHEHSAA